MHGVSSLIISSIPLSRSLSLNISRNALDKHKSKRFKRSLLVYCISPLSLKYLQQKKHTLKSEAGKSNSKPANSDLRPFRENVHDVCIKPIVAWAEVCWNMWTSSLLENNLNKCLGATVKQEDVQNCINNVWTLYQLSSKCVDWGKVISGYDTLLYQTWHFWMLLIVIFFV